MFTIKRLFLLLIVAIVIFFFVQFALQSKESMKGADKQLFTPSEISVQPTPTHACNELECLNTTNPDEIYGTAIIEGYYTKSPREAWGEKKICKEFVITGGSETVRDYFKHLVEIGNSVNRKDSLGNPVINIHPEELNSADRTALLKSTITKKNIASYRHTTTTWNWGAGVLFIHYSKEGS